MKKILSVLAGVAFVAVATAQTAVPRDYIDEYGVNHGKGVEIDGVYWAPVNCGYHATMYPYGKLYQWGRKTGQGYGNPEGKPFADMQGKPVRLQVAPPASVATGQSAECADIFYILEGSKLWFNWTQDLQVNWNVGNDYDAVKVEKDDPCPKGWRVPTSEDLKWLVARHSELVVGENGQTGVWCSGEKPYSAGANRLFLPAAGYRNWSNGESCRRNKDGYYWSGTHDIPDHAWCKSITGERQDLASDYCAHGYSVRCIQE